MKIQYYERVYTGHGEICECFYEVNHSPKTKGIHIAHNIGDKLPYGDNNPVYIAVFDNYFGVGYNPSNALSSLQLTPKKLVRINHETWIGAAEQPEINNPIIKIWIKFNTQFYLWKH